MHSLLHAVLGLSRALPAWPLVSLGALASLALVSLAPSPAAAYLMVIRQGEEAPEVPNAGDFLGWAVASGDFDGDGFDDLAMGAPGENEGLTPHEHGAVVVNFGSPRGITQLSAQWLTVGDITDTIVHYGIALAAGNFNNDAYDDLAVGLPDFDGGFGSIASSGAVWVHLGGPTGLSTVPIVLDITQAGESPVAFDRFGAALAAGDFDLDGNDDLAVGAPGRDSGSGAVFVYRGDGTSGIASAGAVSLRPIQLGSTPEFDGAFGAALAAGDLYDSAHEDLAIGAPQRDVAGMADAGQVYVARGSPTGLLTAGALLFDYATLGLQNQVDAEFGFALAIGHFWDTTLGVNQLAVGEPGRIACVGADCNPSGRVAVLPQFTAPFSQTFVKLVTQGDSGSLSEGEDGDRFGHALAAGDWDDDGFDDLAVGAPGEDIENVPATGVSTTAAGQVGLWLGGADFAETAGFGGFFHGRTLNDSLETGAQVGWALAFGRCDDSGRANLAIGSPTRDYRNYLTGVNTSSAGQVYVLAPWRQIQNRPNRSAVALDCNGQMIYAQRPFQSIPPASVTKAMTVLIACEAIQNAQIDSNYVYTVPDWVATKVSGSSAGLVTGQQIRFVDLIKLAVAVSAGDCCYAIGDILTGENHTWNGLSGTLTGFNNIMNTKAQSMGMLQSHFSTPSGRPLVDHFQTAYDWAIFARQAMTNPLFRYFVGTRVWADIPNWPVTAYGWMQGMQDNWYAPTDGVKPGGNGISLQTGLWSAADDILGRYEASAFGVPTTQYGSPFTDSSAGAGRDLLLLALGNCSPGFAPPPPGPDPAPGGWGRFTGIPTGPDPDPARCFLLPLTADQAGDVQVEIYPQALTTATADFGLEVWRSSEIVLGPGESTALSFSPVDGHLGFRIFNVLRSSANLLVTTSQPAAATPVVLASEAEHVVPAEAALPGTYTLTILNTSSTAGARLQVDERGWQTGGQVRSGRLFVGNLSWDGAHQSEAALRVCVDPEDPGAGNLVYLVVRPPGATVDAAPAPPVAGRPGVRLRAAVPNPFAARTVLAYDLDRAGPVWITLHDLAGRQVRALASGAWHAAGSHARAWDGRDDAGRRVPPGVYFQRVRTARATVAQRVVRVE